VKSKSSKKNVDKSPIILIKEYIIICRHRDLNAWYDGMRYQLYAISSMI